MYSISKSQVLGCMGMNAISLVFGKVKYGYRLHKKLLMNIRGRDNRRMRFIERHLSRCVGTNAAYV